MTGHALGAAGAIELIASILTIKNKFVPPLLFFFTPALVRVTANDGITNYTIPLILPALYQTFIL